MKFLKMINLFGFWRVMNNTEYYCKKYDFFTNEYKN